MSWSAPVHQQRAILKEKSEGRPAGLPASAPPNSPAVAHLHYSCGQSPRSKLIGLTMVRTNKELSLKFKSATAVKLSFFSNKPVKVTLAALTLVICGPGTIACVSADNSTSSAACTNESDFLPGTVLEYESRDNLSSVTSRNKTEVLGPEAFAGEKPVAALHTSYINGSPFFLTTTFAQIKDGRLIRYGDRHGAGASLMTTTYNPPPAIPLDLQPGETSTVSYRTQAVGAGTTINFEVSEKLTYEGRETITTALGTFDTCKFTNEISTKSALGNEVKQRVIVQNWFPAQGPYRGQSIKSVTPAANGAPERMTEVVKMQYSVR